jgi:hypothetical protein
MIRETLSDFGAEVVCLTRFFLVRNSVVLAGLTIFTLVALAQ